MGPSDDESIMDPVTAYRPTIATCGTTFYYGPIIRWRNSFFFATLKDKTLYRIQFSDSSNPTVVEEEKLLDGEYGLLRTTLVGPNGHLYVTTSNLGGRYDAEPESESDMILRLAPDDSTQELSQHMLKIQGLGSYVSYEFTISGIIDEEASSGLTGRIRSHPMARVPRGLSSMAETDMLSLAT